MRIAVLEIRGRKELSVFLKCFQHKRIRFLNKNSLPVRFFSHFTLRINKLYERKVILSSDSRVVLTESRSDMNYTRTVSQGYV